MYVCVRACMYVFSGKYQVKAGGAIVYNTLEWQTLPQQSEMSTRTMQKFTILKTIYTLSLFSAALNDTDSEYHIYMYTQRHIYIHYH